MKKHILKKTLQAYSLLETITSSVIFMIVFLIGMHTLTLLAKSDAVSTNSLVVEIELQKLRKQIAQSTLNPLNQSYDYNWGKIKVSAAHYRGAVFVVNLTAINQENRELATLRFLHANSSK